MIATIYYLERLLHWYQGGGWRHQPQVLRTSIYGGGAVGRRLPQRDRRHGRRPGRLPLAVRPTGVRLRRPGQLGRFSGDNISAISGLRDTDFTKINAFGLITGRSVTPGTTFWSTSRAAAPSVGDRYRSFDVVQRPRVRPGQRDRWGWHRGCGRRVRIRPELDRGLRVRPHLPRQPHHRSPPDPAISPRSALPPLRSHQPGRRYRLVRVNYRWGGPMIARLISL